MKYPLRSQLYLQNNRHFMRGLFTRCQITSGSIILKCPGKIVDHPNRYSLQIDQKRHLNKGGDIDDFINHSCEPNCFIRFPDLSLEALRDIQPGEELTINYCASELKIEEPFECNCGAANCYRTVRGFAYLSTAEKKALEKTLSPFLKKILYKNDKAQRYFASRLLT